MRCPQCDAENPDGAEFCNLCFHSFSPSSGTPDAGGPGGQWSSSPPAPGYGPPPPIAAPPPSDAFSPGGPLTAAPPPMRLKHESTFVTLTKGLLLMVVFMACFAGGWYLTGRIMKGGTKTYTSANTDISFKYPSNWQRVDPGSLENDASLPAGDLNVYNEVILAQGSGGTPVNFLAVGNLPIVLTEQWESAKAGIQESFMSQMTESLPEGIIVSTPVFTDLTVGDSPAYSVKFSLTGEGVTYSCDATVVRHGMSAYIILFMSHQSGGSPEKFEEVLNSVQFKSRSVEGG